MKDACQMIGTLRERPDRIEMWGFPAEVRGSESRLVRPLMSGTPQVKGVFS